MGNGSVALAYDIEPDEGDVWRGTDDSGAHECFDIGVVQIDAAAHERVLPGDEDEASRTGSNAVSEP